MATNIKHEISAVILHINARIEHINSSSGIEDADKQEIINHLSKAKEGLREAKFYTGLAEQSFAFEF